MSPSRSQRGSGGHCQADRSQRQNTGLRAHGDHGTHDRMSKRPHPLTDDMRGSVSTGDDVFITTFGVFMFSARATKAATSLRFITGAATRQRFQQESLKYLRFLPLASSASMKQTDESLLTSLKSQILQAACSFLPHPPPPHTQDHFPQDFVSPLHRLTSLMFDDQCKTKGAQQQSRMLGSATAFLTLNMMQTTIKAMAQNVLMEPTEHKQEEQ